MLGPAPNTMPLGKADAKEGQEVYMLAFRIYYPPKDFELPSVGGAAGTGAARTASAAAPRRRPRAPQGRSAC